MSAPRYTIAPAGGNWAVWSDAADFPLYIAEDPLECRRWLAAHIAGQQLERRQLHNAALHRAVATP